MNTKRLATASIFWGLAAVLFLSTETLAARALPGYSYFKDYISLLGEPTLGHLLGSPLAPIMNIGFIGEGILYVTAAWLAFPVQGRRRKLFLTLGLVHGIGIILVGIFHGGQPNVFPIHPIGAIMTIAGGNLSSAYFPATTEALDLSRAFRVTSLVLGLFGLFCLLMLGLNIGTGHPVIFPDGLWERGSVYAITAWELLVAVCTGGRRRRLPA